jgi:hypothetical protein
MFLVHKLLLLIYKVLESSSLNTFYLVGQNGLSVAGPRSLAAHTFTYPHAKMSLVSSLKISWFPSLMAFTKMVLHRHSMISLMHMRFNEKAYLVEILTSSFIP